MDFTYINERLLFKIGDATAIRIEHTGLMNDMTVYECVGNVVYKKLFDDAVSQRVEMCFFI